MPVNLAHHPNLPSTKQSRASASPQEDEALRESVIFRSILFGSRSDEEQIQEQPAPDAFPDLNLDQIVDTIAAGREEYNLKPYFHLPLKRLEDVHYRQDIFRDLQNPELLRLVRTFAEEMRKMRAHLVTSGKRYYKRQKQAAFLDAIETYCNATVMLTQGLLSAKPKSEGFQAFGNFLARYSASDGFTALRMETAKIKADLAKVRYALHIHQGRVTVDHDGTGGDYSKEVLKTFEKFRQAEPRNQRMKISQSIEMNHIEARILDLVAELHSEIFAYLEQYCDCYGNYCHELIAQFDREVQFYLAYGEQMELLKNAGLSFCFPDVSNRSKEVQAVDTYDLALANQLIRASKDVVKNSFRLKDPERIFVVSGPNQGGKTTFARTFGQLHYMAALGCPVPGVSAKLFLFDELFTHFEKEEDLQNLRGKLEDELVRIHEILEKATANSILIMNESFLSTAVSDALFLSREVIKRITALNMLCVTVTFLDELASLNETTVSKVSTVNPKDPQQRTFKVIRQPANGLAYAAAIADKYHLTYDAVSSRVGAKVREGGGS